MENHPNDRQPVEILWVNALFLIGTPLLAAILAPIYIAANGVHWSEVVAMFVLWIFTGLGITAGYHRMFSHRAWWAAKPVRLLLLIFGAAAWQNSVIAWSAGHRYHHRDVDTDDDPYTITRGFWYAHMLWVIIKGSRHDDFDNVPDLWKDPLCVWQHKNYNLISVGFNLGVPLLLGVLTNNILGMLLWAGLLRIVCVHHATFFINSLAHMWGSRPWTQEHTARDNAILAFFTFGEGYHNFHHTFPGDYRNGVRWWQFDPTKWLIWSLERVGLATNLKRSSFDRRLRRRWSNLYERYQAQREEWEEQLQAQFDEASARFEASLEEARALHRDFARRAEELHTEAARELRHARREAERRVIAEYREFKRLLNEMPQLAPAAA
ncbi:acyl-CoA desaturase [Bradymonadaceae bacterium TMQ3]|uniref:Acyl-CoA desaturase n=1 Tax=Lujinxingia sediminis TaxID=2480984 RepID=A0ABY0CRC2_9DELT|nr:fatty acid desaturase [Lujinxingia sediminis]RDV37895.1 acyl-CoA desaturase [Bradymonadaceae bacterium TMQ3]RVU42775.1 acyl-CoA desaturase [Lujinxingia sediminis]TXC75326.1 acyl-CoA desaturase [Bradymonadales bacterium TMQ1]